MSDQSVTLLDGMLVIHMLEWKALLYLHMGHMFDLCPQIVTTRLQQHSHDYSSIATMYQIREHKKY